MPYSDLREFLTKLEAAGKLHRITQPVDKDWEISAVASVVFQSIPDHKRPAVLFENVKGFDIPIVLGVNGASRAVYCLSLECDIDGVQKKWSDAELHPIAPVLVPKGPVQENILKGEDADITRFPTPIWTVGADPAPFLTAGCVVTRDPETGVRNVGTYRVQIKGPRKLGLFISFLQGGRDHVEKNNKAGKPTPVAIVMGTDPVIGLVSVSRIRRDLDEMAVAGRLRGEAVQLVRCQTVDLEVPATAEIVIEGLVRANELELEGPFGDYTGYVSPETMAYVIDVTCITHRNKPIVQAFLSQMPPSESSLVRSIGRESTLFKHLKEDLLLPVCDLHLMESSGGAAYLVISIKKTHPVQPRSAMFAAWAHSPQFGKFTIVVDDDVDVRDPNMVNWALSFRVQPEKDTFVVSGTQPVSLDPSLAPAGSPPERYTQGVSSKLGIDATRKHQFPPIAMPPKEHLAGIRQDWKKYGFQD